MITDKDVIKCESVFSDDRSHRFLWKRTWDKEKPSVAVVALNPAHADNILIDTTTALIVNNVARLEHYGGVQIVNLFSQLTPKLNFRWNSPDELNDPQNDSYIMKAADECQLVILAWGKGADANVNIEKRAVEVVNKLQKYKDKLCVISDENGRNGLHPLTPSLRNGWILKPFIAKESSPEQSTSDNNIVPAV
ncbi:MAG: DUF1643 domain-containing protein [Oscillospiraceae bacterium]|nr:DUF1643 domain-containing protein [Oscillospiraceae bacterium]